MKWLLFILQLLPQILQVVKAVEEAMPAAAGADKKALVMSAVAVASLKEDEISTVSKLIDTTVSQLNKTGEFTSKTLVK